MISLGINDRIKKIRLALGETQTEFAQRFQKVQSTVASWERGEKIPKHNDLIEIAKLGNVSIDELLGVKTGLEVGRSFGERLKTLRKQLGLSQEDVATRLKGVSRTAYTKYETSGNEPSYENLNRIADILEVSTDYLLGRTDERTCSVAAPPAGDQVLRYLETLDAKIDRLAGELTRRFDDAETDIRLLKKLAAKE